MPGLEPGQVAQLRVLLERGERRGSGYRVTDTVVLTAAHVVADARSVEVVFNADLDDEWTASGTVPLCASAGDVAVVLIDAPEAARGVEPPRFGQIGRRAAVLSCRAVGFPRFKLRTDTLANGGRAPVATSYRDAHQADGTIASLSNWREGTLEITVASPNVDVDPEHSSWEGMSGAAVWCADRIVGVVSRWHRNDGLNRLAAVRVSHWYHQLPVDQFSDLSEMLGLPNRADVLDDVIPTEPGRMLAAAYTEYVEDGIAPVLLHDREEELAELAAFCAGDEFYAWWQAGPWAGKTALVSWFVLHPPVCVDIVSFFITRRLTGQADSAAFTEALVEQLTALTGEPDVRGNSPAARDGQRCHLLKQAAMHADAAGRRLLLLIDGLDEDEGVPPIGPSSIAALLPRRPVKGLRVLVTSRPHPGLPHDVPPDHPLRQFQTDHGSTLRPRRLAPSKLGEQLRVLAKSELIEHLRSDDQLRKDIIGYLAAVGGGLAASELETLTEASFVDLQARLDSTFGRSLRTRVLVDSSPGHAEPPVYLFAHESLRELADQELGSDLLTYRERVYAWAESYEQHQWPPDTPQYLGRPYSRLLAATHDLTRLVRLTVQTIRHDRMLADTYSDAPALAEIADTQQLLLDTSEPDLDALAQVAVEGYRLSLRNDAIPPQLPVLWVHLGQPKRAEQLARSITNPDRQAEVLVEVAKVLVTAGQPDRAEQLATAAEQVAYSILDLDRQAEVLTGVGSVMVAVGQLDRAERLARISSDWYRQAKVMADVGISMAASQQFDRAERIAEKIDYSFRQAPRC